MPLEIVRDLRVGGALRSFELAHALLVLRLGLLEKTGLLLFAVHQHLSGGGVLWRTGAACRKLAPSPGQGGAMGIRACFCGSNLFLVLRWAGLVIFDKREVQKLGCINAARIGPKVARSIHI